MTTTATTATNTPTITPTSISTKCSNNVCPFDFSIPCQQSGDKSWCCDEIQRTTPNGDCKDKIAGCQNKTKMCENPFYEKLMSKMCAMTCNLCNSQYVVATKTTKRWISCSDTTTDCAKRKKEGYCEDESISVEQKKQECISSCSLCE
ncbi:unnamed protein product [Bursaphelenchus xylophilus]|uniref:(pine wood nematode) hypothetical protein n=1 Tax=Bursaphelenchus xylophilus TaxID=6326 RepID=A0A811K4Y5_BURXY|nr:unnamed protein product [Bursaphelenchus xylophilus]CAG9086355.1 unnamed protein product [Bursaphelenchus xylophilus]